MSNKIDSNFLTQDGKHIYYTIENDGFNIYVGENSTIPEFKQYEPYIPDHDKTYEENAIVMCEMIANKVKNDPKVYSLETMRADLDYVLLLLE